MKYQYLKQVEYLLNEYEFEDKYKVMLDLEQLISDYETNGNITKEELFALCGSPADYVYNLVTKRGLTREVSSFESANKQVTEADLDIIPVSVDKSEDAQVTKPVQEKEEINEPQTPETKTIDKTKDKSEEATQIQELSKKEKKQQKKAAQKSKKKSSGSKIIFTLIFALFGFLAFLVLGFSLFVCILVLVFIDAQTAITLLLGVIILIISIILYINSFKAVIDSLLERQFKLATILVTFILGFIFFNISTTLITSSLETISQTIAANLYNIQSQLVQNNVNINNIDWNNLDFNEYLKLTKEVVVAQFS